VKRLVAAAGLLAIGLAAIYGYGVTRREADYRELVTQGDAALAQGDMLTAINAFSGAIALNADSMVAYLKRGEAYRRRNELEAALKDLKRASDLDASATRPRELLGDVNYALTRYTRAAERYHEYLAIDEQSPRLLYKLGLARYRDAQPNAAIEALTRAVSLDDRFAEAHYLLGLCLRDTQRRKESISALERAVALAPTLLQAREELAEVYGRAGRADDRLAQLEVLLALDPGPSREVTLGLAYAAQGDSTSAVQTLSRAARRYPAHRHTYVALGRVWLDVAESRDDRVALGKALESLQSAMTAIDSSEALTLFGRALLLASNEAAAESTLQRATEVLPVDPLAFFYLADAAERRGHDDVARAALLDYHAVDAPNGDPRRSARLFTRIADLSLRLDDVPSAIEWYLKASAAGALDAAALVRFAEAQFRAGRASDASATLEKALGLDPALPAALQLQQRFSSLKGAR
jgi:tetratricopeptide (TPR) repeat protein